MISYPFAICLTKGWLLISGLDMPRKYGHLTIPNYGERELHVNHALLLCSVAGSKELYLLLCFIL